MTFFESIYFIVACLVISIHRCLFSSCFETFYSFSFAAPFISNLLFFDRTHLQFWGTNYTMYCAFSVHVLLWICVPSKYTRLPFSNKLDFSNWPVRLHYQPKFSTFICSLFKLEKMLENDYVYWSYLIILSLSQVLSLFLMYLIVFKSPPEMKTFKIVLLKSVVSFFIISFP